MDITTVSQLDEAALRQVITKVLQFPNVIKANQSAQVGGQPFITVKYVSTVEIGSPTYDFDGENEKEIIKSTDQSTYSVQAFGNNANRLLKTLRTALYSNKAMSELRKLESAIVDMSQPLDISALSGAGMEERSQLDIVINHNHTVNVTQERIDQVSITASTNNSKQQFNITEQS